MRAKMLLYLFYHINLAKRPLVSHFLCLHILGREKQFLRIHQFNVRRSAGFDHLIGFGQIKAHGLLEDHVRGRVSSLYQTALRGGSPLMVIASGWIGQLLGVTAVFRLLGLFLFAAVIVLSITHRRQRAAAVCEAA